MGKVYFPFFSVVVSLALLQSAEAIVQQPISNGPSIAAQSISHLSSSGAFRNVVIEITNRLSNPIRDGEYYMDRGECKLPPPTTIKEFTREVMMFQKAVGLKGVGGLVTYDIGTKEEPAKIAIIYSLPYAYMLAWNWYGVRFIRPDDFADENLYYKMFSEESWNHPRHEWQKYKYAYFGGVTTITHKNYTVTATMSDFGRSVIRVNVMRTPTEEDSAPIK